MESKNIVLCFDGTWNAPADKAGPKEDDSTNVFRFFERVSDTGPNGCKQVKWYNEGVGTEWMNRIRGGVRGHGLDSHIKEGYQRLVEDYVEGDQVYLIGFSRGAYTARSLAGMIRNCGLLKVPNKVLVDRAYALYRSRQEVDSEQALAFRKANSHSINIKYIGVWDTVGSLGIPIKSFKEFNADEYAFHDTKLSSIVQNAYHSIAIDEHREPYSPSLWDDQDARDAAKGQIVEQVWFCGAHADVGGGYKGTHPVADLTLRWMQKKAYSCGLGVEIIRTPDEAKLVSCELHDSFAKFLGGLFSLFSKRYYRPIGQESGATQKVDISIKKRVAGNSDYRPKNNGLFDAPEVSDAWSE